MMFVQVIEGRVADPPALRAALDRWATELAPDATGWLGATAGVTDDGQAVLLARFESEGAARANSERPEQGAWWSQASQVFDGEVTFRDSSRVNVDLVGDPDDAGFVQIIQARASDPARARELMAADASNWASFRPDILGTLGVEHDGGLYTTALYFTSEEEAREGERKEPPAELAAHMEEMNSILVGQPLFLDLKEPWLYSPRKG